MANFQISDEAWDLITDDTLTPLDCKQGIRMVVAAELRRLADELTVTQQEMQEEDNRTIRSFGLGVGIRRLRARADELDAPSGAR